MDVLSVEGHPRVQHPAPHPKSHLRPTASSALQETRPGTQVTSKFVCLEHFRLSMARLLLSFLRTIRTISLMYSFCQPQSWEGRRKIMAFLMFPDFSGTRNEENHCCNFKEQHVENALLKLNSRITYYHKYLYLTSSE